MQVFADRVDDDDQRDDGHRAHLADDFQWILDTRHDEKEVCRVLSPAHERLLRVATGSHDQSRPLQYVGQNGGLISILGDQKGVHGHALTIAR